eukprot:gene5523-7204_t
MSIDIRASTQNVKFPLALPRFMKPKSLFEQLSLILDQPEYKLKVKTIFRQTGGVMQHRLLTSNSYKELSHFFPGNRGRLFIATGKGISISHGYFRNARSKWVRRRFGIHAGPSGRRFNHAQLASLPVFDKMQTFFLDDSVLELPTLPPAAGPEDFLPLPEQDVLLLPDRQFDSYIRRCERKCGKLGTEYAAILRAYRTKHPIQRVSLDDYMKPGKRVRASLVDFCSQSGFSQDATNFILLERDRALDAARKARNRQDIRRFAMELQKELREAWQAVTSVDNDMDASQRIHKLETVVTKITGTQQGINREVVRLDKENILSQAMERIKEFHSRKGNSA